MEISEALAILSKECKRLSDIWSGVQPTARACSTEDFISALAMGARALSFLDDISKSGERMAVAEIEVVELLQAVEEIEQVIARVKRAEALASRKAPTSIHTPFVTESEWASEEELFKLRSSVWYDGRA